MEVLLLKAEEVAKALRIGRSKAYELMASGQLPTVRIGRAVRVPAGALEEWVSRHVSSEPGPESPA
jgi:excisionase family DNA binding protein